MMACEIFPDIEYIVVSESVLIDRYTEFGWEG